MSKPFLSLQTLNGIVPQVYTAASSPSLQSNAAQALAASALGASTLASNEPKLEDEKVLILC